MPWRVGEDAADPGQNLEVRLPKFAVKAHKIGLPVDKPHVVVKYSCGITTGLPMPESKVDLLQGTLDLMVLRTLDVLGPLHGYGIARRIEQLSGNEVLLNQGTIYASLIRLQQRGWISAKWGVSDNNRKAKFYSLTKAGRRQLDEERIQWERLSAVMGRLLTASGEGGKL